MHHVSRRNGSWAVFLSILLLGVIGVTIGYRSARLNPPRDPAVEEVTERYKQLASAQGDMSKWLLGLASGALVGLIGLRLQHPENSELVGNVLMAAYALLILSLYGAFLSYQATVDIFRRGPLNYLYGDQFRFPVLVQFWSLIAALTLIGAWLFRLKAKLVLILVCLILELVPTAKAQEVDAKSCLQNWYKDRLGTKDQSVTAALSVIRKIQSQPQGRSPKTCVEFDSVLDQLRFSAVDAGKPDDLTGFDAYLTTLQDELSHPDLSTSDVVHSIIDIMSPWDEPLAILSVRARGTYYVILNANPVGVTNWTRRLKPGTYNIRVVKDFQVAYSADTLRLEADETKVIDIDKVRP